MGGNSLLRKASQQHMPRLRRASSNNLDGRDWDVGLRSRAELAVPGNRGLGLPWGPPCVSFLGPQTQAVSGGEASWSEKGSQLVAGSA